MFYGEAGPLQFDEITTFGGARHRLHYRPPTTEEWERHEVAYQNAAGAYVSPVESGKIDVLGVNRAHTQNALAIVTGIEVMDGGELPVEGDWREWLKGSGIHQPVLRRLAQWAFLGAAKAAGGGPPKAGGAAPVAGNPPAGSEGPQG